MGEANRRREAAAARRKSLPHPNADKNTPWGEDDTRWFEANPLRAYRARPVMPGEYPGDDQTGLTALIRQDEDGLRSKCVTRLGPGVTVDDDEDDVRFLFAVIAAADEGRHPNELLAEQIFSTRG